MACRQQDMSVFGLFFFSVVFFKSNHLLVLILSASSITCLIIPQAVFAFALIPILGSVFSPLYSVRFVWFSWWLFSPSISW